MKLAIQFETADNRAHRSRDPVWENGWRHRRGPVTPVVLPIRYLAPDYVANLSRLKPMRSKATIVCCLLSTAIVLHTCIRIEVLNARNGHFLPRTHPAAANPRWRVAARQTLARSMERTIAIDRLTSHVSQHPDDPEPEIEEFIGPPYTDAEQALIDTEIARNMLNSQLRDWVSGMGLLQYLLAPVALLSSLVLLRGTENLAVRFASVACAVSNVTSMYLMVHRGYFTSLGW